jgi:hypothetical protein
LTVTNMVDEEEGTHQTGFEFTDRTGADDGHVTSAAPQRQAPIWRPHAKGQAVGGTREAWRSYKATVNWVG